MPLPPRRSASSTIAVIGAAVLGVGVAGFSVAAMTQAPAAGVAAITSLPSPERAAEPAPTTRPATPSPRPPSPSPLPTPLPTPTATPTSPPPTPAPVLSMNLYARGDFVSQATKDQCVAGAMQIMLNVIRPEADTTKRTQAALAALATDLSDARDGGTEPRGWAQALEELGAGGYEVMVAPTRGKAIERAVRAIRATGRPAGLLVWRGAHSWVLHGFEATADPAGPDPMTVTHVYVSDPWYPRISSIWGESRGPNARVTPAQLEEDFLPWRRPTARYPGMDGAYVVILPVDR